MTTVFVQEQVGEHRIFSLGSSLENDPVKVTHLQHTQHIAEITIGPKQLTLREGESQIVQTSQGGYYTIRHGGGLEQRK